MQERQPPASVVNNYTREFVREYVSNDDYKGQILPLDEKQSEVISRNLEAVLEHLLV